MTFPEVWDRVLDFAVAASYGLLDWLVPVPEIGVDRATCQERERLREVFRHDRSRASGAAALSI